MSYDYRIIGKKIKELRDRLKITQKELAKKAGFSVHQTVSQIEKGQRDIKAWELASVADALHVDMYALLSNESLKTSPSVLWRKMPEGDREIAEATFIQKCEQYVTLEQLSGSKVESNLPSYNEYEVDVRDMQFKDAKKLAFKVSKQMNLGVRPANSLEKILEEVYGVKIWYEDLGDDGSAASTISDFGPAILMNSSEPPWRRNFSFAHELFHLITWDNVTTEELQMDDILFKKIEKLADNFASVLLLPTDSLEASVTERIENNAISDTDLIEVAREYMVSTQALIYRLASLDLISQDDVDALLNDPDFRAADKKTMATKWSNPPEIPERFVRLAFNAYRKGRLSRTLLAEYLNKSLLDLTDFLLGYGLNDREGYETQVHIIGR